MKTKQTKVQQIAALESKLHEALAGQAHVYHYAHRALPKAVIKGGGVIVTITALGGREIIPPVLIRDGLSEESIAALQADMVRSYDLATSVKP